MLIKKLHEVEVAEGYCLITPLPDNYALILRGVNEGKIGLLQCPHWYTELQTEQKISCYICKVDSFLLTLRTNPLSEKVLELLGFTRTPETQLFTRGDTHITLGNDFRGSIKTNSVTVDGLLTIPLILSVL